MKISLAITLFNTQNRDLIEEGDGDGMLAKYIPNQKLTRVVATNIPNLEIAVTQRQHDFNIFLVNKDTQKAVGYIHMTANKALNREVYEEKTVYFAPSFRNYGSMSALYRWFLDAGHIYMSDDLHSPGSAAVWNKLTKEYKSVLVDTRSWKIVPMSDLRKAYTQLVLFGRGRSLIELKVLLTKVNK